MWTPWKRDKRSAAAASAEERVKWFLADYQAQWRAAGPLHDRADQADQVFDVFFPQWAEMLEPVKRRHFMESSPRELGRSFGGEPEYASTDEDYVRSEVDGDTTRVLYGNAGTVLEKLHEYVVHAHDGDFTIFDIVEHYSDPALPFVDAATIAEHERQRAADAPFRGLPEDEVLLDQIRNFTDREVRDPDGGETSWTEVTHVGHLTTSSGVLSVSDFGWDNDVARPLAHSVSPGTYPIDRVTAFGRNAAVRVRFSESAPVTWKLANRAGQESDTVGVDHGCICIADFAAYSAMTPREKNAAYGALDDAIRPKVLQFPLAGQNVGFACDSGWGDGSYPVYWGLDSAGQIAQLVVDFSVLVTKDEGLYRHL